MAAWANPVSATSKGGDLGGPSGQFCPEKIFSVGLQLALETKAQGSGTISRLLLRHFLHFRAFGEGGQ